MFGFCKKSKGRIKPLTKIAYEEHEFDVQCVEVRYKLLVNGAIEFFTGLQYGRCTQYVTTGYQYADGTLSEPSVEPVAVFSPTICIQDTFRNHVKGWSCNLSNDPENPTKFICGDIVGLEILENTTKPYKKKFTVAKVVPNE